MKKIATLLLLCALLVSCSSGGSGESKTGSESASAQEETYGQYSDESTDESPEESSESYDPSSGELEKQAMVKSLEQIGGEPEVTLAETLFDFGVGTAFENLTITGTHEFKDGKLYLSDSAYIQYRPKEAVSAERIVVSFGLDIVSVPETLETDAKFTNADDIFIVSAGDASHWYGSEYDYSVRFRATKYAEGAYRFFGYSNSYTWQDLAKDKGGLTEFGADGHYVITLTFENDRCYISINDGQISVSYYSPVDKIKDLRFIVRKGVTVALDKVSVTGTASPEFVMPETLMNFIDSGCVTGYVSYKATSEGVYFNRLSRDQFVYNGLMPLASSDSGVQFDFYTNTKKVEITYKVMDSVWASGWEGGFDVYLNGEKRKTIYKNTIKGGTYTFTYTVPDEEEGYNRITVYFPPSLILAVLNLRINEGAVYSPVPKDGSVLMFGDSITEGLAVDASSSLFSLCVARAFNLQILNQAVSGTIFSDHSITGDYGSFKPDYILIAYGTNNYGDGSADFNYVKTVIKDGIDSIVKAASEKFPEAKIIGLLPLCRSGEEGKNFTLLQTSEYIAEVYGSYNIPYIDCHDFVPLEQDYFHDTMLHPNAKGNGVYGEKLVASLKAIIGDEVNKDWKQEAEKAFDK